MKKIIIIVAIIIIGYLAYCEQTKTEWVVEDYTKVYDISKMEEWR